MRIGSNILCFLLLLTLSAVSHAQSNFTVVYNEMIGVISFDKQKKTDDYNRRQILYTNGDSVALYSFSMQKPNKKNNTVGKEKDHHAIFIFPDLGRNLGENYWTKPYNLGEYPLTQFDWKFHGDTMRIAGYRCNVAVADGIVAWYTKDIQSPFGPLHYTGLPGLILLVEDHKYKRIYKAASVKLEAPKIVLPDLDINACTNCESKLDLIKARFAH